ncbi:DNA polymerase III subunit gamma/tau [Aquabacterium lacunae]|uniref:DNA polymerase III subunit gamma/tau n=1 Tax=Aquabacterium lacunae TaxID=2528630 RepID=A0A4Q9H1Y4_9BURK|nr:DNA polymerase III subunit gamma/tau [Aquabacterium lacunae]TBO28738.1 DNA polymerase III subunit gamma/tau [Aquabacterium lacunae]
MTSTVLARKYRPRSFDTMVGQGHVVQALANALTQQRLHHAYMFTGTRGVGKTTVSRILAKSLNCVGEDGQGGITARPCGVCQPCRDIDAGRFVDYVELDAASNRGVEEISQLLDQAVYKPVVGRFKVYMIDEVHMLSNTAFNAMLKTLEEPPDYLKFVLATTDPQKVPVTVLSRCLQFNLRPMAIQTVQEHLSQVLGQERVAFDAPALKLLARAARGSMRDGLSLTDQAIAFGGGRLEEAVVRQMLGSVDRQHIHRILQAVAAQDGVELVAAVDHLRVMGLSATGTLDELAAALQQMAMVQTVPQLADHEDAAPWRELAGQMAADETQLFYSLALQGRAELALAPDEYAGLLMILLRWLAFKPGQVAGAGSAPGGSLPKAERPVAPVTAGRVGGAEAHPASSPKPVVPSVASPLPQSVVAPAPAVAQPAPAASSENRPEPVQRPEVRSDTRSDMRSDAQPRASAEGAATVRALASAPAAASPATSAPAAPPSLAHQAGHPSAPHASAATAPAPWDDEPAAEPAQSAEPEPDLGPEPPAWDDDEPPSMAEQEAALGDFDEPGGQPLDPWDDMPLRDREPDAPASTPVPVVNRTPLGDRWEAVVKELIERGLVTALVRELCMQAECIDVQDRDGASQWRLRVERENLRSDNQRDRLVAALTRLLGGEVSVWLEAGVGQDTPALRDQADRASRQAAAEVLIRQDPMVDGLLRHFTGARIVPGSITPI